MAFIKQGQGKLLASMDSKNIVVVSSLKEKAVLYRNDEFFTQGDWAQLYYLERINSLIINFFDKQAVLIPLNFSKEYLEHQGKS